MNKNMLVGIMRSHGDFQRNLAEAIGLSLQQFNKKLNAKGGAEFSQGEIAAIKRRYQLTDEEIGAIFFGSEVS